MFYCRCANYIYICFRILINKIEKVVQIIISKEVAMGEDIVVVAIIMKVGNIKMKIKVEAGINKKEINIMIKMIGFAKKINTAKNSNN